MNKEFLLKSIALFDAIKNNDTENIDTTIAEFNNLGELDVDCHNYLCDFIRNCRPEKTDALITAIEKLNDIKDKEQFKLLIKIVSNDHLTEKEIVDIIESDAKIENNLNAFIIFSALIPQVVNMNNNELTKKLIDKIQEYND